MLSDTSHVNSPNIAASLPPELLFIIAIKIHSISISLVAGASNVLRSLCLSQVCRHWRYAFLSNPTLWTMIAYPDLSLPLVKVALARSGECPLEVTIHLDPQDPELEHDSGLLYHYCDLIFAHLHRIETLTLMGYWSNQEIILDHIYSFLIKPATKFKLVRFSQACFVDTSPLRLGQPPERFLHEVAPQLKEFNISSVSFAYRNPPVFESLACLSLMSVRGINSVAQLLNILEASSSTLRVLKLHDLYDLSSNSVGLGDRSIQLASLQSLSLDLYPAIPLMLIMSHIKFPPDINWDIHCNNAISTEELDITPLLCFLNRVRTSETSPKFLHFNLDANRINDSSDSPADTICIEFKTSATSPSNAKLQMHVYSNKDCTSRLERLVANLVLSEVHYCRLFINFIPPSYEYIFGLLFSSLSGLRELSIICAKDAQPSLLLMDLLRPAQTSLLCPQLIDLTLEPVATDDKSWIQVLHERKAAGNILTNIRVAVETYDPDIQRELESLAENVILLPNRPVRYRYKYYWSEPR